MRDYCIMMLHDDQDIMDTPHYEVIENHSHEREVPDSVPASGYDIIVVVVEKHV